MGLSKIVKRASSNPPPRRKATDLLEGLNPEQSEAVTHGEGPVLLAAVAGAGKCVTGDTIVATPSGPRRIDECRDQTEVSHSVDASTLDVHAAHGTWLDMGISPVIEVETNNGFKIRGTPEHPLLVWRGEPVWTRLDHLCPEDYLMLLPGYGEEHGKESVDPEEAYLLGLFMGDGWTCRRNAKGNKIEWSRGGQHLPPQFYDLVQRFWDGTPVERTKPGTNSVTHGWTSKATYQRLHDLGCAFSSARDKFVPTWLIGASPLERTRFLQGYFDTDGSASGHDVEIVSASERLARDVQQMLLALGVVSRVSPKKVKGYDHVYWRIIISGDQARLFAKKIGFRYEKDKIAALSLLVKKPTNPNKGCYPMTGSLLRTLKDQWSQQGRWNGRQQALDDKASADYLHDRRAPSKAKLSSMVDGCDGPAAMLLRNLTSFYLDPVCSIKEKGSEHVYDFTIPGSHSFIANGIVSHNTRALVHRVAYLVSERGVDPSRILAVTFSKAGADEMNDRLKKMLPGSGARIGTFHSVAYELLRAEVPGLSEWTVDDRDRFKYCVKDAAGFRELDWKQCDLNLTCNFIGFCKAHMARPYSDKAMAIALGYERKFGGIKANPRLLNAVYERADEIRADRQLLTFDDMMLDAAELLQDNETVRRRWAGRYDWVLQDEAQDQSMVQMVMGELLAKDHRNYLLVGDPSQAIYSWRGALPSMLLSFEHRWTATVIQMCRNYRCGQAIIDTANKVLNAMNPATRLDMEMVCEKGTEGKVVCNEYDNLDDEAEGIATEIAALLADGTEPRDIALLYRVNAQSRAPEEALISRRIPYVVIGGANFYNRKEIKDLLAYLRVADGRGTLDDVRRCINAPFRFLGKAFVEKLSGVAKTARAQAKHSGKRVHWPTVARETCTMARIQARQRDSAEKWADLLVSLADRITAQKTAPQGTETWDAGRPVNILEDLILAVNYTGWLIKDEGEETAENSKVSNVRELVRASRRFPTVGELLNYIDDLAEASKSNRKKGEKPNKVVLTTLHRSKGLEWENVFLTGANENILPHGLSEDIEEERRLFYVGVTRAKERLAVSCVREIAIGDNIKNAYPSRFISEAGLTLAPNIRPSDAPAYPCITPKGTDYTNTTRYAAEALAARLDSLDDISDEDEDAPAPNAPFLKKLN